MAWAAAFILLVCLAALIQRLVERRAARDMWRIPEQWLDEAEKGEWLSGVDKEKEEF